MVSKKLLFYGIFLSYALAFAVPTGSAVRTISNHKQDGENPYPSSLTSDVTTIQSFGYPEGELKIAIRRRDGIVSWAPADLILVHHSRWCRSYSCATLQGLSSSFATEAAAEKELLLAASKKLKMYGGLTSLTLAAFVCLVGRGSTSVVPAALCGGATVFGIIQALHRYDKINEYRLKGALFTKATQSLMQLGNEG